jgi:hypothetical protein
MRMRSIYVFTCLCGKHHEVEEAEAFTCVCGRRSEIAWGAEAEAAPRTTTLPLPKEVPK